MHQDEKSFPAISLKHSLEVIFIVSPNITLWISGCLPSYCIIVVVASTKMQRHDFLRNRLLYVCHRFWIGICRNTFFHVEPQRTCLIKILYWTKSNWRCSDDSSISSRAFEHGFQPPSSPEHMCVTHNTVFIYSYYLFCSFLFEFNNKNKFFDVKTFSSFFFYFQDQRDAICLFIICHRNSLTQI